MPALIQDSSRESAELCSISSTPEVPGTGGGVTDR